MTKTIIIYDNQRSEWESVQSIKTNLVDSYRLIKNISLCEKNITPYSTPHELWKTYEDIVNSQPDKIVFIDGVPHPSIILPFFKECDFKKSPDFVFHIYGDFTLKINEWIKIENILKQYKCTFLCASPKQVKLIQKFIKNGQQIVNLCPFAISSKTYNYNPTLRNETRKKLKIEDDEKMIIYTGRISYQKNIHFLINYFYQIHRVFNLKCKYYIVGDFDDLGAPFIGKHFTTFYYFNKILDMHEQLPENFKRNLIFTGKLEADNLNALYNASDLFTSFSVHNDEDFGMSPLEALGTGTPAVISDWGGYSAFKSQYCKNIETKIEVENIKINFNDAIKETIKMLSGNTDRSEVSSYYQNNFTIENTRSFLEKNIKPQDFQGFSKDIFELKSAFEANPSAPLVQKNIGPNAFSDLYKRLYSSYES